MQQLWSESTTVQKQIFIETPVEDIFAYLATLENLPRWDTWLNRVTFAGDTIQGIYSLEVAGLAFPLHFPVTLRLIDLQEPTALTVAFTGMIQGELQWILQAQTRGTLVRASVNYQFSQSVIGEEQARFANIRAANTAVVEQALTNIKNLVAAPGARKQVSVLVVEDNKSIQELLSLFLRAMGNYSVISAASGAEALEKLALFHPDLVLLDYHLPDMTGLQLYDHLHARAESSPPPILLMSAGLRNNPALSIELAARSLSGLQKPFHLRELQEAMARALSVPS